MRTVYVKLTLENDSEFESMSLEEVATWVALALRIIGTPDITVWDSLNDTMAAEMPTVAGTLIDLLKNGVYDGK